MALLQLAVQLVASAVAVCNITVPISEATHLDVGGSILGLGLRLASPKGGASASGSVTLTLPRFAECPNWALQGDAHKFWRGARFSLSMYLASEPTEIVIKAGTVPINVHSIATTVVSNGELNASKSGDGFEGRGALRIVHGGADAMGHDFDLRTTVDSAVRIAAHISTCQLANEFELVLDIEGSFKSDDLPGSNSHVDILARVVSTPPHRRSSGATIASVTPATGAWNEPTTITVSGTGLVDADGRPVALSVHSSHGTLAPCADATVLRELEHAPSRRGGDDGDGARRQLHAVGAPRPPSPLRPALASGGTTYSLSLIHI